MSSNPFPQTVTEMVREYELREAREAAEAQLAALQRQRAAEDLERRPGARIPEQEGEESGDDGCEQKERETLSFVLLRFYGEILQ